MTTRLAGVVTGEGGRRKKEEKKESSFHKRTRHLVTKSLTLHGYLVDL